MRRIFFLCIGWLFILVGVAALYAWFLEETYLWIGAAAVGQLRTIVAGGLLALVVVGVLMVVGETDSRN